ncbi:MAG: NADPH-dependent glutamate synthase [Candidatus Lernaella stagnicola]|nr:NADPH-dependent glutamate synthase [Candidatus Lernaella stagnicola]
MTHAPHERPAGSQCRNDGFRDTRILERRDLTPSTIQFRLEAPRLAQAAQPGQFIVLRMDERAERLPLTIVDFSPAEGWITIIFQPVGASTRRLAELEAGDVLLDLVGPLGTPSQLADYGTVVCVGGGVGVAPVYPIARALKAHGNKVISIIGARSKDLVILEDEMAAFSDEVIVCTDDGSYGRPGFVTDALQEVIDRGETIDRAWAIGPVVMMAAVSRVTEPHGIHTEVSLNSIMLDGSGMCGACRVEVGGGTKFVCVDGPEFDGHQVNFKELMARQQMYVSEEHRALWDYMMVSTGKAETMERMKRRIEMPRQDPRARVANFDEVALGYSPKMARTEAQRCLQCKSQPCTKGCPVDVPIPEFIHLITEGRFRESAELILSVNSLPAVCGRVCPQESQCEQYCVLAKKGNAIAIGRLERFVADYHAEHQSDASPPRAALTGKKIAVVGSGPAGLTAAADLARLGHDVEIFEAFHKGGGVLVYGIPEFRLPKDAVVRREIEYVKSLGVRLHTSYIIGRAATLQDLMEKQGFDAVFLGTGAGLPYFLNIPGENLNGVYSANEFLTRVNLMKAYKFPEYDTPVRIGETMAVVGGGNVAMDSARVALRLGAKKVYCIYRRTKDELPARAEEVENAIEEGVDFRMLTNPLRFLDNGDGWLSGVECIKMELGEPDDSGRRRPIPIPNSEHVISIDIVIIAIGQGPNPLLTRATPELKTNKWGNITADPETGLTNIPGVYAGGDIVTGAATVILAMGAGKKAAKAIDAFLSGEPTPNQATE